MKKNCFVIQKNPNKQTTKLEETSHRPNTLMETYQFQTALFFYRICVEDGKGKLKIKF